MFIAKTHDVKLPQSKTIYSAGFDICSNETIKIYPHDTVLIGTAIALDIEKMYKELSEELKGANGAILTRDQFEVFLRGHFLDLRPRSSIRMRGLSFLGDGTIDLDYKDEIMLLVHNHNKEGWVTINKGDPIGQLILMPHAGVMLSNYQTQNERVGGFGSTDEKKDAGQENV